MTTDLQAIEDRIAICDGMARFCRTLDTKDWTGFADTLTEDFELDIVEDTQRPAIKGRDAVVKAVRAAMATAITAHHVHSPEIEIEADEANTFWAMQDRVVSGPKGRSITGYGHYYGRWVKQDGRWKMASLKVTRLHVDVDPPAKA